MPAVNADDQAALPRIAPIGASEARDRRAVKVVDAPRMLEGAGFEVRRAFAEIDPRLADPFILLDHLGAVEYAPGEAKGAPDHPHRGFETVTYMMDGELEHRDSNGGGGLITDGATQWMTAGAGIVHGVDPSGAGRHWAIPLSAFRASFPEVDPKLISTQTKLDLLDKAGLIFWPKRGTIPRQKRYLDESPGVPIQDIISDVPPISSQAQERMGYATQKPLALMERIIKASSNPGEVVLDPFCGCATTLEAAHRLDRRWIGIDIAIHAIKRVARVRLTERLGLLEGEDFTVEGVPRTVEGAQDLWERDEYHFQKWAVEQTEGFVTTKRSADGGIDGRVYFAVPHAQDLQSMVVEVKGGANPEVAPEI